jgi:hypothetical protein
MFDQMVGITTTTKSLMKIMASFGTSSCNIENSTCSLSCFSHNCKFLRGFSSIFDYGKHPYGDKKDLTNTTKLKRYGQ